MNIVIGDSEKSFERLAEIRAKKCNCSDGLVGYDTTFTRWGPWVRLPLGAIFAFDEGNEV